MILSSCFLNALLPAVRSCSTDTNWSLSINSMSPEFRRVKYSSSLAKKWWRIGTMRSNNTPRVPVGRVQRVAALDKMVHYSSAFPIFNAFNL